MEIEMETVRDGYINLAHTVLALGDVVSPRGLKCHELTGLTLVVHDPLNWAMPVGVGRKLNTAIGAAEALQLLSGTSYPNIMTRISKNFGDFLEGDPPYFYGAYGPRVAEFLPTIQTLIENDPDTRQAVVPVWRPYDVGAATKDLPCTALFQFLLRHDRLNLEVYMRSNDFAWGWTYDGFQFSRVQAAMADALGVPVGRYTHHVGSFHVYDRDVDLVYRLETQELADDAWFAPTIRFGRGSIRHHQIEAGRILQGLGSDFDDHRWFTNTLEPYLV